MGLWMDEADEGPYERFKKIGAELARAHGLGPSLEADYARFKEHWDQLANAGGLGPSLGPEVAFNSITLDFVAQTNDLFLALQALSKALPDPNEEARKRSRADLDSKRKAMRGKKNPLGVRRF